MLGLSVCPLDSAHLSVCLSSTIYQMQDLEKEGHQAVPQFPNL